MPIETRLKEVVAKTFKISVDQITDDTSMDNVENWDSLNHSNLVMALEQEFDISFDALEIIELLNYKLILLTLNEKIPQK